jgi:ABC-type Na+ efflux pump permease subunit
MIRRHILAAIVRKELMEVFSERQIRIMFVVGLIFPTFIGWQMTYAGRGRGARNTPAAQARPAGNVARSEGGGATDSTAAGPSGESPRRERAPAMLGAVGFALGYGCFLGTMFAMTLAIESFAGEKERRTVEVLLATPATDRELFLGKALSCLMVSAAMSFIFSFTAIIAMNAVTRWYGMSVPWKIQAIILAWAVSLSAALSLSLIALGIIVSSRVSTVKAANQLFGLMFAIIMVVFVGGGFVVASKFNMKPVLEAVVSAMPVWALAGIVFLLIGLVDMVALSVAARTFNRERIMTGL